MAMKAQAKKGNSSAKTQLHVVGIGASAGGLEALQDFFSNMPSDSGLAFVVIQHLSPDYKSLMVELLSKHTAMKVVRGEEGMPVQPDTVFLIPPKKNMIIQEGRLYLTEQAKRHTLNLPIDIFFQSLAKDLGERAVGIILSGTGSDGTRGIRALKEAGGMIMIQSPESAKFDGMPKSALGSGLADYTLEPSAMPSALIGYLHHPYVVNKPASSGKDIHTEGDALAQVFSVLRDLTGVDFAYYKPTTVYRRIERRMGIVQANTIEDYAILLRNNEREAKALYRDLLIGVTKFFRDPEAFEALQHAILPKLIRSLAERREKQLRIWTVGCSTGEEAYSIAMLLSEEMERLKSTVRVKIFATDLDRAAIETASGGFYPESVAADVDIALLSKFFNKEPGGYRVKREIREMVVFAQQNVAKDPPFTKIDLISCRNLLIYLQAVLQKKVMSIFNYALRPGGYLFLGSSETVGDMNREFLAEDSHNRIYRHIGSGGLPFKDIQPISIDRNDRAMKASVIAFSNALLRRSATQPRDSKDAFFQDILNRVASGILVINDELQLLHSFGQPMDFLRLQPGQASLDILGLLPKELSMAVSSAVHRVRKDRKRISYSGIRINDAVPARKLNMAVDALDYNGDHEKCYIVMLSEYTGECDETHEKIPSADVLVSQRIDDLEQELQFTKENLQATIEELQTSNEELQATNEELLAANEELQSTNEELHSVNEELNTVNSEYQEKISELTELYNDMNNFISSTDVGTVFLDAEMRIRRFTPSALRYIKLQEQDIGRPINAFALPGATNFDANIRNVLKDGQAVEQYLVGPGGGRYLMRLLPYRSGTSDQANGVIITFIDITSLHRTEAEVESCARRFQVFMDNSLALIHIKDVEGVITSANQRLLDFLGRKAEEVIGRRVEEVFPEAVARQKARIFAATLQKNAPVKYREEYGPSHPAAAMLSVQFPMPGDDGVTREVADISMELPDAEACRQN